MDPNVNTRKIYAPTTVQLLAEELLATLGECSLDELQTVYERIGYATGGMRIGTRPRRVLFKLEQLTEAMAEEKHRALGMSGAPDTHTDAVED